MPCPETIQDYLRLCGRQHKRKYVAMLVMGSMAPNVPPMRFGCDSSKCFLVGQA